MKCLQAARWASWCFCTVWWAGGFVAGQLWWRQAFHYAACLPVRPLPGYKCLGRALKGPARASLPHTALQAILTQVRTRRHRHAKHGRASIWVECGGESRGILRARAPVPGHHTQANPSSAWGKHKKQVQSQNEPPMLNSRLVLVFCFCFFALKFPKIMSLSTSVNPPYTHTPLNTLYSCLSPVRILTLPLTPLFLFIPLSPSTSHPDPPEAPRHVSDRQVRLQPGHRCQGQGCPSSRCLQQGHQNRRARHGILQSESRQSLFIYLLICITISTLGFYFCFDFVWRTVSCYLWDIMPSPFWFSRHRFLHFWYPALLFF